jgi:hypothetical protein
LGVIGWAVRQYELFGHVQREWVLCRRTRFLDPNQKTQAPYRRGLCFWRWEVLRVGQNIRGRLNACHNVRERITHGRAKDDEND